MKKVEPKSGLKTTEFWGKTIIELGVVVLSIVKVIEPKLAIPIVCGLEGIYNVMRGILKK